MTLSTADLHDADPDGVQVCEIQFRSFGTRRAFGGPCVPIKVFEDHHRLKEVIAGPGDGRVLVVDGGGSLRVALMGDQMAAQAKQNGWAGIVVNGAVRDSETLEGMDFCVKAVGTTARRSGVDTGGLVDHPVSFGGATFRPGAWVYADADAVIVSDRKLASE